MRRSVLSKFNPVPITFLTGAILLAVTGQVLLAQQSNLSALVIYAMALLYWVLTFGDKLALPVAPWSRPPENRAQAKPNSTKGFIGILLECRSALLPIPLGLSFFTFLTSTDNTFTLLNVSLWLLSIITLLALFVERPHLPRIKNPGMLLAGLALLLALGGFFYYYRLDQIPLEMTSDHAEKLQDIFDVLHGKFSIFFTRNTGREPLEFYLVASFIQFIHHRLDFMSLKWIMATIGLLAVPLTFGLGTVLFDGLVGWLAGAFVAINLWGVGIARMGLRFAFTPFFTALTLLLFFRALKSGRRNDYLLTGLMLGAGLYGYHAFKIVPLVVAVCFLLWLALEGHLLALLRGRANWQWISGHLRNFGLVVLVSLVVFMPLFRYMVDHPDSFFQRILTRVTGEERPLPGDPALVLADNLKNDLLMFNVEGDHSWPNTLSNVPVLDEVSGGLFVLGVAYALYRWLRRGENVYALLLAALVMLLLPSALAIAFPIENPSVVRTGGAIPVVFILVALPLARLGHALLKIPGRWGMLLATGLIIAIVAMSAQFNYTRYFEKFDEQYRDMSWNSSEVAATMLNFAENGGSLDHAWVVAFPHWVDTRNVAINLGNIQWENVIWHVREEVKVPANEFAPRLYILSRKDSDNITGLQAMFPGGVTTLYPSETPGKEYVGFYVPLPLSQRNARP